MGFLKDLGGGLLEKGLDFIGVKYQSDLQAKENNRAYDKTRADALADWEREKQYNLDLWNMQNEYNSPKAQMARLKEAGLNPNLMYGQGTTGNTTVIKAGDIHEGSLEPARIPDLNLGGAIENYMQMRRQGLAEQAHKLNKSLVDAQVKKIDEERKITEHDRRILEKTGMMSRDPFWFRMSGRLMRMLKGVPTETDARKVTPPAWKKEKTTTSDSSWKRLDINILPEPGMRTRVPIPWLEEEGGD